MFWANKVKRYLEGRIAASKLSELQRIEVVEHVATIFPTDPAAAERILSELIRLNPREALYYATLAQGLSGHGRSAEAQRAFERALLNGAHSLAPGVEVAVRIRAYK